MPASRKRKRVDPDIIRTEKDNRRATGEEEDDEFELEETTKRVYSTRRIVTTRADVKRKYSRRTKATEKPIDIPFLDFPPEIRNMIYRELVVSKLATPIDLTVGQADIFLVGGIEAGILSVNRQIFTEASTILYGDNKFKVSIGAYGQGVDFRVDDKQSTQVSSKSLRSGRKIDMKQHKGVIYPHVFRRLRNIDFNFQFYDPSTMCVHVGMMAIHRTKYLINDLLKCHMIEMIGSRSFENSNWTFKFKSGGGTPLWEIKEALFALLYGNIGRKWLARGSLRVHLEGKFPPGYEKVFKRLLKFDTQVNTDAVEEDMSPGCERRASPAEVFEMALDLGADMDDPGFELGFRDFDYDEAYDLLVESGFQPDLDLDEDGDASEVDHDGSDNEGHE